MKHAARVLAFAVFASCAREPPVTPAPTTTSAAFVRQSALDEITGARCTREQACENVGPARKHPSFGTCVTRLMPDSRSAARLEECARGVADRPLEACLEAIRAVPCESPLDALGSLAACAHGALCI
jgi:hypothetical protein